jgi:hypothetical protein
MVWICEACGYYCTTTWETCEEWRVDTQCTALAGMATVALVRAYPLRTVCVHPDGTGSWGGAEVHQLGTVQEERATPERAQELLSLRPAADSVDVAVIEAVCWLTLAGPIAANGHCFVALDDCPEEFARTLDALSDLPEGHRLRVQAYDEAQDSTLHWLQGEIITLLEPAAHITEGLSERLQEAHWLAPAALMSLWDESARPA